MNTFSIGDGVTTTDGPMKGQYGTVVYLDEKEQKYLVRFAGTQQMYYPEDEIVAWT
ncbi:hypothetical protein CZ771_02860 [Actinomycetales bacterium JB111]|nr:hypothetical protein CZ771_02860 [Actinomycetales bacterium JB111]